MTNSATAMPRTMYRLCWTVAAGAQVADDLRDERRAEQADREHDAEDAPVEPRLELRERDADDRREDRARRRGR